MPEALPAEDAATRAKSALARGPDPRPGRAGLALQADRFIGNVRFSHGCQAQTSL